MCLNINRISFIFVLSLLVCSCSQDVEVPEGDSRAVVPDGLQLRLWDVSSNIRDYTDIYIFNGGTTSPNYYHHTALNVERTDSLLKSDMPVGTWNLVLVGCNEADIRSRLISPATINPLLRSKLPMWRTVASSSNLLPDVPEIRTALLDGVSIVEDGVTRVSASLERNVAKVRVVVSDAVGFQQGGGHTFSLKDIPTTLSWDGSLYPDKVNPEISGSPMTKNFELKATQAIGHLCSDTIDFIIPAHKSTSNTDTTTHKIRLAVNLITSGGKNFLKDFEVQRTPKDNTILLLCLTANGAVTLSTTIKDWSKVVSSDVFDIYTMYQTENDGIVATFSMNMLQDRNWRVALEDTYNFEFAENSTLSGQYTDGPVHIRVKRKTSGEALSTMLNLYISGFDDLYEQYSVSDLHQ